MALVNLDLLPQDLQDLRVWTPTESPQRSGSGSEFFMRIMCVSDLHRDFHVRDSFQDNIEENLLKIADNIIEIIKKKKEKEKNVEKNGKRKID